MAPHDPITQFHRHKFAGLASLALLATVTLLSGCSTTYNSAGDRYYSFWPFIGSRNPELQLSFPTQSVQSLQLGHDPDPFYLISPQPPIDPRVTSPYSQAPADPDARVAGVSDNAACAERCDSMDTTAEPSTPAALRADAGGSRSAANR